MPDDPFDGLGLDRTVMMPVPGGRTAPRRPTPEQTTTVDLPASDVSSGLNALVAAANPLLNAIPPLRASVEHPNPSALRDSLVQGVRSFEARARAAGTTTEKVVAARYALCTLIDETAANTPWGASGAWAQHGLLAQFHGEVEGGDKFFQILSRLAENPQANLDVLELLYVCLQLGLEGRYRIVDGGQRQLEAIRQRLLAIIRQQRGEYERDLSPAWRGLTGVGQRRLSWLPLWVVGAVAGLVLVGIYLAFSWSLSGGSDALASQIASIRLGRPQIPERAERPRPAPEPRLAPFLADEIRRGLVSVDDRTDRSVVTILGDGLFKPGDPSVGAAEQALLGRIGEALTRVNGQVEVVGHTDNVPIRTLRFPSNFELSKARAESVSRLLIARVPPARVRAEGRGDTEPLAANDTPAGRARNRRVEIILYVPSTGSPDTPPTAPAPRS